MALIKFTKDEVGENNNDFALIPEGKYTAQLCNHDWKATKSGGHMLALTWEITGPAMEGRKVFDNLNLDCSSEDAQKIALRSYKSICMACDAESFYDAIFGVEADTIDEYISAIPENLYAHDVLLNVGIEKSKDPQYSDKNKVKQYGTPSATAPAAKPAAGGKAKPSWAK